MKFSHPCILRKFTFAALLLTQFTSCRNIFSSNSVGLELATKETEFVILQLNDVYEINPVEGGTKGGLARVATIRKNLLKQNPNVITVLSGDFISPSAMGTVKINGEPLNGKQMIDTLNTLGLDFVTLGNHELDLGEQPLLDRIAESKFTWISSNVHNGNDQMYPGVVPQKIIELKNNQGLPSVKLGLLGVTLDMVKKPFVKYQKPATVAKEMSDQLGQQSDVVIALTHLNIAEDKEVAIAAPRIDMLLGGHEHQNTAQVAVDNKTPIFKADSNVRTVYVHKIKYNFETKKVSTNSELVTVDATIPEETDTAAIVKSWTDKVFTTLKSSGTNPEEVVGISKVDYDGIEASVRSNPTNLTRLIGEAFLASDPSVDAVVFGGGSIRIDDHLMPGPITQWDIIRIFPFGGKLIRAQITGEALIKVLIQGELNKGNGGFLHHVNISKSPQGVWQIQGQDILASKTYNVSFNEFLVTGQEKGLSFLNLEPNNADVKKVKDGADVRSALIDRVRKL